MEAKKQTEENNQPVELDGPWKYILARLFQQFMELCVPEISDKIDWSKDYINLNPEFQKIVDGKKDKNTKAKKKIADLLFKVQMTNGQKTTILLHLEVQGQQQQKFPIRLIEYSLAISENYEEPVLSIALLLDTDPKWYVDSYEKINPLTNKPYHQFFFYAVKLLHYASKLEELKPEDKNFALVLRAQLNVMETQWTKRNTKEEKQEKQNKRYEHKIAFARELRALLRKNKVSKENMESLQKFLDCIIKLPEDLMLKYNEEFTSNIAEDWEKTYISTAQLAGMVKGRQEGEASLLARQLKRRFSHNITAEHLNLINNADRETLSMWGENLMDAKNLEEVFASTCLSH